MNVVDFPRPENWRRHQAGPRYLGLRRHIEAGIASSVLTPDASLPSEREIASVTVRNTIQQLADSASNALRICPAGVPSSSRGRSIAVMRTILPLNRGFPVDRDVG